MHYYYSSYSSSNFFFHKVLNSESTPDKTDEEILKEVSDSLLKNVPELSNMAIIIDKKPDKNSTDYYLKNYYYISVGEKSSDTFTATDHFYVFPAFNRVLWGDTSNGNAKKSIESYKVAKSKNTTPSQANTDTKVEQIEKSTSPRVYKSRKLDLSITFPNSWSKKYTIEENDEGIYVNFKSTENPSSPSGLLFCLVKKTLSNSWSMAGEMKRKEITINKVTYYLAKPKELDFPKDHPEYNTFYDMSNDTDKIIKNIKSTR